MIDYCHLLDKTMPILDIGAGQGRHAVFLAKMGFSVDAIDPSRVAVETLRLISEKASLHLRVHRSDFESFTAEPHSFSGILVFGLIQELRRESICLLVGKIRLWVRTGGLVFVIAHTTDDPSLARFSAAEQTGKNSFLDVKGNVHTYLEPNEILRLFNDLEVVYHWEGLGRLHRHGDGPPEKHGVARALFRKTQAAFTKS